APRTDEPRRTTRPAASGVLELFGFQVCTNRRLCVRIRAGERCAWTRVVRVGAAGVRRTLTIRSDVSCFGRADAEASARGGGSPVFEPPSAKTWSSVAVPPFDDVGVPPTVIATYCLPPTE